MERSQTVGRPKIIPNNLSALARKVGGYAHADSTWPWARVILWPMTRHKHAQTGLVTPQLPQLLLTAVLRAFAMLVLHVASTLQMLCRREAVNATQPTPADLPQAKTDTQQQEPTPAAQHRSPPYSAHPEQRSSAARPSKDERVLTTVSQTPTPSVSLGSRQAIHLPQCSALMEANRAPMRATKGNCLHHSKSGGGGLRVLARKTEGAHAISAATSGETTATPALN